MQTSYFIVLIQFDPNLVFLEVTYCSDFSVFGNFWVSEGNFFIRTAAFKAYCAILVRRSNFRHQASPRVSPRENTQRRKVELW
jgi:hypothetical protein